MDRVPEEPEEQSEGPAVVGGLDPGDELVADPKLRWNVATTIDARPAEIWPWLVQMGCRRAGWYSYDGLDNGGVRSADRIIAELQEVQVGDVFPMRPQDSDTYVVRRIEPERALVIGDAAGGMSWAFVLEGVDEHATRLITRVDHGWSVLGK